MTRESSILKRTWSAIRDQGGDCYKTDRGGEPDLFCCLGGRTIVIETKQPNHVPEALQLARLRHWAKTGAMALFTDNAVDFYRMTEKGNFDGRKRTVSGVYQTLTMGASSKGVSVRRQ